VDGKKIGVQAVGNIAEAAEQQYAKDYAADLAGRRFSHLLVKK
jgi:hypothetical protein